MHLFLIDLYVCLDTLAPIIDKINSKKVIICNVNPIQNYKNDKLLKYLLKKNIKYINFLPVLKNKRIFYFLIKMLILLPCFLQKKTQFLWNFIYYKYNFSSKKLLKKLLLSQNITSITYSEGCGHYINDIYLVAKEMQIPVIHIPSGMNIARKYKKISDKSIGLCDYYISPNYIRGEDKKNISFKVKYFGAARYSKPWINKIKFIINFKNHKNGKKLKLGFFKKYHGNESLKLERLINKLKSNNNLEIRTREKPRDVRPLKCASFNLDKSTSSELIEWSDIIITSRPTSVLLEAISKNKIIIFLEYLNTDITKSLIYNYSFIKKIKNESDLLNFLFKKENNNFLNKKMIKKCIEKFLINFYTKNRIEENFKNFYKKLKI
jgi:hypothetical protein